MKEEGSPKKIEGHEMHRAKESHGGENHAGHSLDSMDRMAKHPEKAQKVHHGRHEGHVTEDFKRKFIISLILTVPILILSPFIQDVLGFKMEFPGSTLVLFLLATFVYFYGGSPFLKGFFR
ncbi:MAG: heavy metal translocating P-type ATPase, partial [Methanotrichaceae archaeon]